MTPIVRKTANTYESYFLGKKIEITNTNQLHELETDINNSGSYPILLTPDQYTELNNNKVKKDELFLKQMKSKLRMWLSYAQDKLQSKGIRFLLTCGNDDNWELDDIINESSFIENPENDIVTICGNHEVVSESSANITPFSCPRDISEELLETRIRNKISKIKDMGRAILVLHCPPYNSKIDSAPELDSDLKPILRGGQSVSVPVGSTAVKNIIEEFQPLLTLHGHIHESSGFVKIGRTICINPGSEYSNGILRSYLISVDRDSVRGQMLLTR